MRRGYSGRFVGTVSEGEESGGGLGRLADQVFDGVIFDMDGTLIDSTPAVVRSWSTWATEYGFSPKELLVHHGIPAASVVRSVLPEDQQAAAMERINALELADLDGVVVLPGAADALAALIGAKNAIATSCTVPLAEARIRVANLVAPSVLVTADDVSHGKPHPEPFLVAAQRMGVDPTHCLVVEDAPKGLEAARAAGCFTLAVTTTTAAEKLDADAVVPDLSAITFTVDPEGIRVRLRLKVLAGLPSEGPLGLDRPMGLHLAGPVVDVVLALPALLGSQRLPELAFGLLHRVLLRDLLLVRAHRVRLPQLLDGHELGGHCELGCSSADVSALSGAASDCSSSGSVSVAASDAAPTSVTAVPYAATSLSDWVISLQSKRSPTTASAPAASAISTSRADRILPRLGQHRDVAVDRVSATQVGP